MSLATSLFFGVEGRYDICGIDVHFQRKGETINVFDNTMSGNLVDCLLKNPVVKCATLGYLHVFIHEMGHALAAKLCEHCRPTVHIYTNLCQGEVQPPETDYLLFRLAGPILSMLWEIAKLTAVIALTSLLPPPIRLPLGILLGSGSVFWLIGEVGYACSGKGDWDFTS